MLVVVVVIWVRMGTDDPEKSYIILLVLLSSITLQIEVFLFFLKMFEKFGTHLVGLGEYSRIFEYSEISPSSYSSYSSFS